jgi:multidrug efflux pump subunit AcrA (membrane-fusion protein)
MTTVVQALRQSETSFVLPLSSLQSNDGPPRVWRVETDGRVTPVAVRTAGFMDDSVRIVDGLKPGDRIVTAGANLLRSGQVVRVLGAETAAAPTAPAQPGGTAK